MNCNVHVFCKMTFNNKFGFILEAVFSYTNMFLQSFRILQKAILKLHAEKSLTKNFVVLQTIRVRHVETKLVLFDK